MAHGGQGICMLFARLWDFACICTCMTYVFLRERLYGMYVYDDGLDWSPGMYYLMYIRMLVCLACFRTILLL